MDYFDMYPFLRVASIHLKDCFVRLKKRAKVRLKEQTNVCLEERAKKFFVWQAVGMTGSTCWMRQEEQKLAFPMTGHICLHTNAINISPKLGGPKQLVMPVWAKGSSKNHNLSPTHPLSGPGQVELQVELQALLEALTVTKNHNLSPTNPLSGPGQEELQLAFKLV